MCVCIEFGVLNKVYYYAEEKAYVFSVQQDVRIYNEKKVYLLMIGI